MARTRVCPICKTAINAWEACIEIPVTTANANGGRKWIHTRHADVACYHAQEVKENIAPSKALFESTAEDILIAPELEFMYKPHAQVGGMVLDNRQVRGYAAYLFSGYCTHDSTVDVELNVPPVRSLRGFRDRLGQLSQVVNMTDNHCGAHIHASVASWVYTQPITRSLCADMFNPLREYLLSHEADCIKVFGRGSSSYADIQGCISYIHGDWINGETASNIEYRLPHFVSVDQYMLCLDMCKRFTLIVNDYLNNVLTLTDARNAIVNTFKKAANGTLAVSKRAKQMDTTRKKNQQNKGV